MIPILLTIFAYYVIVLAFGLYGLQRQTATDYVSAPGRTHFIPLTLTLVATVVGGGMFLGVAQIAFEQGLPAFSLGIAYLVGSVILGILAPQIRQYAREHNVTTLFGVIEILYPSKRYLSVSILFSWMTFAVFFLMLAAQFVAISTFLSFYIELEFHVAMMVGAGIVAVVSTLLYASSGGFTRDIFTDTVQMVFIFVGLIIVMYALIQPSFLTQMQRLPSHLFSVDESNAIFFIGSLIFVPLTFAVRFDIWQRIITARTDAEAKAAFIVSGILNLIFFVLFGIIGLYGKAHGYQTAKFVGLDVIQKTTVGVANGLVIAAFFAAVMSSADTFLGVAGLALAKGSIYPKHELEILDKAIVSVSRLRWLTMVVGAVSIVVAMLLGDIVDIFASSFGVLGVFLPSVIGAFVRKNATEVESYWSIGIGLLVVLPLTFVVPKEAFLPGVLSAGGAYWLAINFSKKQLLPPKSAEVVAELPIDRGKEKGTF
jgi:SSS family solute:Na+ symporter